MQHSVLQDYVQEVIDTRTIELIAFCIMPNHFHLIIKELKEGGISNYMQRVLNAYSKYYNTKYDKSGHVFQGPYKAVHVGDDRQLLHLSTYIHRNPREITKWLSKENHYYWSSYQDMVNENRWGNLLLPAILTDRFKDKEEYHQFVKTSPAKLLKEELEYIDTL